jgi:hypothetical protein
MADSDFDVRLKKEAKTSLAAYRDQSLLRRKFGDEAVKLYNLIDSGRTASQLMAELGMAEDKFMEILEFMNNNAMVGIVPGGEKPLWPPSGGKAAADSDADAIRAESASEDDGADGGEPSDQAASRRPRPPAGADEEAPQEKPPAVRRPSPQIKPPAGTLDEDSLSPLEKILYRKHGAIGVRIYNLIDGEKTAEEILRETGVSEAKLVEILKFMDEQGIIKLEKPEEKKPEPSGEGEEGDEDKPAREPRFKPFVEDVPEGKPFKPPELPKKEEKKEPEIEEPGEDIVMVDVPQLAKLSVVQKAMMFAELSTKFPPAARQVFDMADGNRDFVGLSLSSGMSLFDIDAAMAYFGKKGFVTFRQLGRLEIKERYGEDGFAIYKRFGRDGLLIYEMIGKEASLRDIILKSKLDPDRAIDIFSFIHKVLGLDIPLDRDLIYRQIGLKK